MTKHLRKLIVTACAICFLSITVTAQDVYDRQKYASKFQEYVGSYQLDKERYVIICLEYGGAIYYVDWGTGRFGSLSQTEKDHFSDGKDTQVSFERDPTGKIQGIQWQQGTAAPSLAKKVGLQVEQIKFSSRNVTLSGTLILPIGEGPHPVIIVHGGSDWKTKEDYIDDAYKFASYGIGAFVYDKRGWGDSTGERDVPYYETATDAVAAVNALKLRTDINPKQIGLSGFSQTGWVVPLAASLSKDVAFLHLLGAPFTFGYRQEMERIERSLRADAFSEDDIRQAVELMRLKTEFSRSGLGWNEYIAARQKADGKSWDIGASGPATKNPEDWKWMRLNFFYNPLPAIEKVTCPVLALYGEVDRSIPPEVNIPILEMALDVAGNRDFTIKVIPNASHSFKVAVTGGRNEKILPRRFAPDYLKTLLDWTKQRVNISS